MNLVQKIESILPTPLVHLYRWLKKEYIPRACFLRHKLTVMRLAGKREQYNVIFLLEKSSNWKYNSLYDLMKKSRHFNPTILVCPNVLLTKDDMITEMQETYDEMKKHGYRVLLGYNVNNDSYIDVRSLEPHVIFFTNAWEEYIDQSLHIRNFPDILTCYMNYGWATTPYKWSFVSNVSTRVWMYLQECQDYNRILKQWTPGMNAIVTGSPMYEAFLDVKAIGKDWKVKDNHLKRIIYAPHHTIPDVGDGPYALSTFFIHCNSMLEIAELYKDRIQFVFKPHPLLINRLYQHPNWGKDKADAYYKRWANGSNTSFVNGEYIDLFKTSDAIIHDCSSFTMEYLYTKKPALFLANMGHEGQSNEVAMRAYNAHYKAKTKEEICDFLNNVVLKGIDPKKNERENFFTDILLPPNGRTASENILYEISRSLKITEY